jgi:hypothetical protein
MTHRATWRPHLLVRALAAFVGIVLIVGLSCFIIAFLWPWVK